MKLVGLSLFLCLLFAGHFAALAQTPSPNPAISNIALEKEILQSEFKSLTIQKRFLDKQLQLIDEKRVRLGITLIAPNPGSKGVEKLILQERQSTLKQIIKINDSLKVCRQKMLQKGVPFPLVR